MIGIIDYGMGNLRSVQKAFEAAGNPATLTRDSQELCGFSGLVLPGVGAFGRAMENLHKLGIAKKIVEEVGGGKPFLGICLGLQLLFSRSEESFGNLSEKGLDIIPGVVHRFPADLKVPQIGWNQIVVKKDSVLLKEIPKDGYVYFVHSYYVKPYQPEVVLTTTDYGMEFVSSVAVDNVYAIQFHPEKSSTLGLKILKNFGEIVSERRLG